MTCCLFVITKSNANLSSMKSLKYTPVNFVGSTQSNELINGTSHSNDVIMGAMTLKITSLTIVYSIVYSKADQSKHQSSASLAFVRVTGEFPAQRASNAEIASIWWRNHPQLQPHFFACISSCGAYLNCQKAEKIILKPIGNPNLLPTHSQFSQTTRILLCSRCLACIIFIWYCNKFAGRSLIALVSI